MKTPPVSLLVLIPMYSNHQTRLALIRELDGSIQPMIDSGSAWELYSTDPFDFDLLSVTDNGDVIICIRTSNRETPFHAIADMIACNDLRDDCAPYVLAPIDCPVPTKAVGTLHNILRDLDLTRVYYPPTTD